MKINLNGEEFTLDKKATTAWQLIEKLELTEARVAMEVNLEILPKSQLDSYTLQNGDKVEIVHAIGGG